MYKPPPPYISPPLYKPIKNRLQNNISPGLIVGGLRYTRRKLKRITVSAHPLKGFCRWKFEQKIIYNFRPKQDQGAFRPRNKSGRYTGHYDRWITKFTSHSGIYAGHCHSSASFFPHLSRDS